MLHDGPGDLLYMKGLTEPVFQEHSDWLVTPTEDIWPEV